MEYIKLHGTEATIHEKLSVLGMTEDDTRNIISFLAKNKHILDTDEFIKIETLYPDAQTKYYQMMFFQNSYNINIKTTTLVIAALILDITLTKGVAATLLSLCGVSNSTIVKLNESNGEKCIVKETILSNGKIGNANILSKFHGECCNNDISCTFRKIDKCTCRKEDIINIYERLTDAGVFKKNGTSYKYQW